MRWERRESFSPPLTSKETASQRSRHVSRQVRDARAMMHVRIANPRWWGNVPDIPGACAILRIWQEAHYPTITKRNKRKTYTQFMNVL